MKMYDDQHIVITGGAGFIGSAVIRHLNNIGMDNIIIVDDLGEDEKWKNLVGKSFREIIPTRKFFEWLVGREQEIEAFVHLGACSSTVEKDASYLLENNTNFSIRLAEYALKHSHRLVYASSAATYGNGELGFSDDHAKLKELKPLNMYGFSKHMFDLWAQNQGVLDEMVGLKYFNVFGPNEQHKGRMASAINHFVPQVQMNGVIRLFKSCEPEKYSDGGQMRDFIYVKDAVRFTCAFLENDIGGIFNIGTGIPNTWKTMAEAVFEGLGQPPTIDYIDMPDDLLGKYQSYTCAEINKLSSVMDTTTIPFREAVVEYVKDYLIPGKYF